MDGKQGTVSVWQRRCKGHRETKGDSVGQRPRRCVVRVKDAEFGLQNTCMVRAEWERLVLGR